jgi:AraC-like DNA-binding protein/quercetin dioxygenase-like cupin family protein
MAKPMGRSHHPGLLQQARNRMIRSNTFHAYQSIPRPVSMIVVEHDPEPSLIVPSHSHPRAQLAYAVKGTFTLHTPTGAWLVPPNRAVWVPGGVVHEMHARGQAVSNRSLYIQPDASPNLPTECCVIEVSPLMRQLVIDAIGIPLLYDEAGRDGRVMRLILDEICAAPKVPLHVPMPQDARLLRICRALLDDPGSEGDLEYWARFGALGRRTLTRLFRDETGITFTMWRQQVRLMEALRRLAMDTPVTTVAMDLGYESPSAFTAMFRRVMGKTPKHYLGRCDLDMG